MTKKENRILLPRSFTWCIFALIVWIGFNVATISLTGEIQWNFLLFLKYSLLNFAFLLLIYLQYLNSGAVNVEIKEDDLVIDKSHNVFRKSIVIKLDEILKVEISEVIGRYIITVITKNKSEKISTLVPHRKIIEFVKYLKSLGINVQKVK